MLHNKYWSKAHKTLLRCIWAFSFHRRRHFLKTIFFLHSKLALGRGGKVPSSCDVRINMWEANAAGNPARGMSGAEQVVQEQTGCLSHCPRHPWGASECSGSGRGQGLGGTAAWLHSLSLRFVSSLATFWGEAIPKHMFRSEGHAEQSEMDGPVCLMQKQLAGALMKDFSIWV